MHKFARSLMIVSMTVALGACSIFGGSDKNSGSNGPRATAIGVNGYLWQAALDTLSFMPFDQLEPNGGVILTGWHSTPEAPNERVKVTVRFLSPYLRSDGLKVSVIRQEKQDQGWINAPVQAGTALRVEEAILTAARRLRIDSTES